AHPAPSAPRRWAPGSTRARSSENSCSVLVSGRPDSGLGLPEPGDLGEARRLLAHLGLTDHPVDGLLLEHLRLYLSHHLGVLQVRAPHFLGVRIGTGD